MKRSELRNIIKEEIQKTVSKPNFTDIQSDAAASYDEKKAVLDSLYKEGQMYLNNNMLTHEMLDKLIEWIENIQFRFSNF